MALHRDIYWVGRQWAETGANETRMQEASVKESAVERSKPAAQKFVMRIEGWPATFTPQWRIRIKR